MTVACYPLDAVSGAPAYTGRILRDTIAALIGGATAARPLGAFSGVRPGTPSNTVTLSGLNWTCKTHAGILDVQAAAEAGPYLYAVTANETGTLNAQAVGNARSDLLVAQLSDPAEGDGTSVPKVEVVYVPGVAGPGAPDPSLPARSMRIGRFNVPASGGGSPTFTWLAPTLHAAGARASVPAVTDLAGLSAYTNMEATVEATPGAFWKYNGSSWVMHGLARFTDAAARLAAIPSPVAGMRSRAATEPFDRVHDGARWLPALSEVRIVPVATVAGGSVFVDDAGAVIASGAVTAMNLNFPDATLYREIEVTLSCQGGTSGTFTMQLRSGSSNDATTNAYLTNGAIVNSAGAAVTVDALFTSTAWRVYNGSRQRRRNKFTFFGLAQAVRTAWSVDGHDSDIGSNLIRPLSSGEHTLAVVYDGLRFNFSGMGTFTELTISAIGRL